MVLIATTHTLIRTVLAYSSDMNLDQLAERVATKIKQRLRSSNIYPCMDSKQNNCHIDGCKDCGHCAMKNRISVMNFVKNGAERVSATPGVGNVDTVLAAKIDHTLLKAEVTKDELEHVCNEALQYKFASVCVNPSNVAFVANKLKGSVVKPIAVVGFPLGATTTAAKAFEAQEAIRNGAKEIDMVINLGALRSGDYGTVLNDISRVVEVSRPIPVKVILEAASLDQEQKIAACVLSKIACAAFVKTSTGFGKGGATLKDVQLMRRIVGKEMGVKASGGIRSTEDAEGMVQAGADRIGASASVEIVTRQKISPGGY